MSADLSTIDPAWAWAPYVPDQASPWNRRRAAHLYWRAGFAATMLELDEAVRREPLAVVRELTQAPPVESFEARFFELKRASPHSIS